jgi:hypothetical protein
MEYGIWASCLRVDVDDTGDARGTSVLWAGCWVVGRFLIAPLSALFDFNVYISQKRRAKTQYSEVLSARVRLLGHYAYAYAWNEPLAPRAVVGLLLRSCARDNDPGTADTRLKFATICNGSCNAASASFVWYPPASSMSSLDPPPDPKETNFRPGECDRASVMRMSGPSPGGPCGLSTRRLLTCSGGLVFLCCAALSSASSSFHDGPCARLRCGTPFILQRGTDAVSK